MFLADMPDALLKRKKKMHLFPNVLISYVL